MNFKKRVNGSWTDSSHYIHNTSTDAITTLPTVIYPTDTTATVGLKGQTLQSSIPSPTSLVMPQGTGDLETSGTKAGQYKIPISSANTTTPVYLGEVETTRKIRKLVLTGEETLTSGSVIGQIRAPLTGAINSLGLCTHYILKTSYGGAFPYIRIRSNTLWFEISPDGYETKEEALTDFKSYLTAQYDAGTPVTIWYVLATPETAVVNEPLMKIGAYADTVSGITIPTIAGANTLSVDTTLQPSEVSVNYKGWHPITNAHEHNNGAWN